MCKERCGAPLEPMRSKGSGLPRLKSGSVGSAEKRSTGPFFVSASPRLALLVCPKVVRYLVYSNMVHCVTDHIFVQREVRSTSRTHAEQGFGSPPPEVGLGRFGGKKVHRTFFCVRLTPSRAFVLPKSGPLFSVQEGGTLRNGPFLMRLTIFLHWMYSNDIRRYYYVA